MLVIGKFSLPRFVTISVTLITIYISVDLYWLNRNDILSFIKNVIKSVMLHFIVDFIVETTLIYLILMKIFI